MEQKTLNTFEKIKMLLDSHDNIVVSYHSDCMDGLGSYAAIKHFLGSKNLVAIPSVHGEDNGLLISAEMAKLENPLLLMSDFCLRKEEWDTLINNYSVDINQLKVVLLDHHESSEEVIQTISPKLGNNFVYIFDMLRSGATITWDTLSRCTGDNILNAFEELPLLLKYIQDRDIWTWELPRSKEVSEALATLTQNNDVDLLLSLIEKHKDNVDELADLGEPIHKALMDKVAALATLADEKFKHEELDIIFSLSPGEGKLNSELGHFICNNQAVDCAVMYEYERGKISYSLRSTSENAKKLAIWISEQDAEFSGGGHPNASGAKSNISFIETLRAMKVTNGEA